MVLAPSTPLPLDPYERRADWAFAVLVLALVAHHGGTVIGEGSIVARSASGTARARPAPRGAPAAGRLLRPPRSC